MAEGRIIYPCLVVSIQFLKASIPEMVMHCTRHTALSKVKEKHQRPEALVTGPSATMYPTVVIRPVSW